MADILDEAQAMGGDATGRTVEDVATGWPWPMTEAELRTCTPMVYTAYGEMLKTITKKQQQAAAFMAGTLFASYWFEVHPEAAKCMREVAHDIDTGESMKERADSLVSILVEAWHASNAETEAEIAAKVAEAQKGAR